MKVDIVLYCMFLFSFLAWTVHKTQMSLRKPRRQRQRERRETKGLMKRTMALHVRYNFWYISWPSSAEQQREMTKFCVV